MDGAMVNVRGEGWKEAKIGCVFEVCGLRRCPRAQPSRPRLNQSR